MGTKQSNQNAQDFFKGVGGKINGVADGLISTINAPGTIAKSMSEYINSPLGGIMMPIVIIGGLYVVSQVLSNRR